MSFRLNPYQYSNPVYRHEDFFNCHEGVSELVSALRQGQSVQVVGQYRIGKSSLLRHVQEHIHELLPVDRLVVIYYDLSRRPSIMDGNDFFARMWHLLAGSLVERGEAAAALPAGVDYTDWFEFDEYLRRWVEQEGYQVWFLLDEAGTIAGNPRFDVTFWNNLRAESFRLHFVLAASKTLADYADDEVRSSPYWNQLKMLRLTLVESRAAIDELIWTPAARVGHVWTPEDAEFIYHRGGQHPCYIQMAAAMLFDTLNATTTNRQRADKSFRDTAGEHFRFLWKRMIEDLPEPTWGQDLRALLIGICQGQPANSNSPLVEQLVNQGLIWWNQLAQRWEPLSAAFGEWVLRWHGAGRNAGEPEPRAATFTRGDGPATPMPPLAGQPFAVGTLVLGKYRVRQVLPGSNRYHHVVTADDEKLGRKVVIKCLRLSEVPEDHARRMSENLIRSAGIMANLQSRNIGQVFDVLDSPTSIVMEWIDGEPLDRRIQTRGPLPLDEVQTLAQTLARTLTYLHGAGVQHRDLKPGNVILTADERCAVLIDFDIARDINRETITRLADGSRGRLGTVAYSAPEQLFNPDGVGGPTDMFALGIVLYETLTGELPFPLGNAPGLYGEDFPPPKQHSIPEAWFALLRQLLDAQPARRLTAQALLERLARMA